MTRLNPLPTLLFAALALTLTACGGGAGGIDEFASDPSDTPPAITIVNGTPGIAITRVYLYESYTGETIVRNIRITATPKPVGRLNASQYDVYVEYSNGHRSYVGDTSTADPYNGQPIGRGIPRVNPGERAVVTMYY